MYSLCSAMKWNHLPVAGGIYDQHPELLTAFREIFAAQAKHDEIERKKQEKESKRAGAQSRPRRRR